MLLCELVMDLVYSWTEHVNATFHKASQVRGLLQRNLRPCSRDVKLHSFKLYVDPILDYASAVWSPYFVKHINKIENVQ